MANNDIIVSEMTPASQINTGDLMIMTQPDAQSETGYSTKSGTVLQVSNKMLKGTTYETDLPSFVNKNVLGGMEELKGDIFNLLPVDEASGSIANFETELAAPLPSVLVNVLATGGNGTPDNPNPINGYSEANITNRTGVNIWDEQWELVNGRVTSKNYIRVTPSTRYFFYNTNLYDITMYDSAYTNLGHPSYGSRPGGFVFQTAANCVWIKFDLGSPYGSTYLNDVSINYPETDMEYHPYNGQTYTIAFGQTVYGGVLDVTRGKLSVTYISIDNLKNETWSYNSGLKAFIFYLNGYKAPSSKLEIMNNLCETYQTKNAGAFDNLSDDLFFAVGLPDYYNGRVLFRNLAYTDVDTFKATLEGVKLVYELATPFDIDLTPEVISAIVGVNNVFGDCGGVDVKFKDTIQHYIDKKIAQTQALIL